MLKYKIHKLYTQTKCRLKLNINEELIFNATMVENNEIDQDTKKHKQTKSRKRNVNIMQILFQEKTGNHGKIKKLY